MKKAIVGIIVAAIIGASILLFYPTPVDVPMFKELRLCSGIAACFEGKVTAIIDGDTIDVDKIRIRLALASTPELNDKGGIEAKEFAASLCPLGSRAIVDEDDGQKGGSFGRTIGAVYCEDDVLLNAALLDAGHAYIDKRFCAQSEFSIEDWARAHGC